MSHTFAIDAYLGALAAAGAMTGDPNGMLYTARANELFTVGGKPTLEEGLALIRARVLLIPSKNDNMLSPEHARKVRDLLRAQGNVAEYFELDGPYGHLDGAYSITQASEVIERFLQG